MVQWYSGPANRDKRVVNNFSEGVDTGVSPFFVKDSTLVDGYGWDFGDYPAIQVRKGRTSFGASGGAITRLLTNFGNKHLVRAVGTKLQYNNGSWTDITGTWTNTDWDATNFDIDGPALIMTNGTDTPQYWNGTALKSISSMPKGKYTASDNRRVYTAGMSANDRKDTIAYCAFQNALDWTSSENSGEVQFYTDRGGDITALKAFQGQIYGFKKDAFCLIFHTGDARNTHRLVEGSNNIGCVSHRTVVEVGDYLMWLGEKDVYICAGGTARGAGGPVRKFLDKINQNALNNACAFTDKGRYYICIPTGSNTQPDTCLVYDINIKKWLPYSINLGGIRCAAQLNNVAYAADANGMTYKMNDSTTDNGTAISWMIESRPFDDGMKEAEKELYQMYLQGLFPQGTTLKVDVSPYDTGNVWHTINYNPMDYAAETQNKRLIVPLDTVPLCYFYRYRLSGTGPATIQEVQRYSRIHPEQF